MQGLLEWLDRMALVIALTLFGGITYAAKSRERTVSGWFCCLLAGWFSGIISYVILTELNIVTLNQAVALSLACASTGGLFLDSIINNLADVTGRKLKKKD